MLATYTPFPSIPDTAAQLRGLRLREFVVCEAQFLGKIVSPLHPTPVFLLLDQGSPPSPGELLTAQYPPADKLGDEGTFRKRLLQGDGRLCRNRLSLSARARLASQHGRCQPPWWWKWLLVALRTFRPHSRSPKALQPRPRPLGSEGRLQISQARGGPGTGRPLLTEPVCVCVGGGWWAGWKPRPSEALKRQSQPSRPYFHNAVPDPTSPGQVLSPQS